MATGKAVFGGLLAGAGEGIVMKAKRMREDALEAARQLREDRQRGEERTERRRERFEDRAAEVYDRTQDRATELSDRASQRATELADRRSERATELADRASDREYQGGLMKDTFIDEEGNVQVITGKGGLLNTGVKAKPERTSTPGSITDRQQIELALERNTVKSGNSFTPDQVDRESAARELREEGRPDLAELVQPGGESAAINKTGPAWLSAVEEAENEAASRRPGLLSRMMPGDQTAEAFGGKTEVEYVNQLAREKYRADTGRAPPSDESDPASANATATGGERTYASENDVLAAYKRGELTRAEAERILREQFDFDE